MRAFIFIFLISLASPVFAQQAVNWDISNLRIGEFKLMMKESDAVALARKPLQVPSESNRYQGTTIVKYNNELINVTLGEHYTDVQNGNSMSITELSTKSAKFKTRSGIGVGSSREELWNTYKDLSRIEIFKPYDADGERIETDRNFSIFDEDAGTMLTFVLRNNKVIEIRVSIAYEGC